LIAAAGFGSIDAAPAGPSIVSVDGRRLLVSKRNLDNTLALAVPYLIRGVG